MARIAAVVAASILCASLVSGCRTVNVSADHSIDQAKNTGVAVISLTMSGVPTSMNMFVNFRGVGGLDHKSAIPVTDLFASSDWKCPMFGTATEAAPCGRLAIVELQPGDYEFYSWNGAGGNMTMRSVKDFSKRFTVVRGKAIYLGNIHFAVDSPKFTLGSSQGRFAMRISDQRERDLPLLRAKHPKLSDDLLLFNILPN